MDLKKFLPGKDEETREYFWSLSIEPGWVEAGIWRIQDKKAQVIFSSPPTAWELESEIVNAVDTALSAAAQNFPEDVGEPSKTVIGVVTSWVTSGQIKEEYLLLIKKICSELSLKPVGFVVLPEAISHLTKAEEGSPLNAIVLGVYKDVVEVSLFKLGSLLGSTTVARSVSIADDVTEGLTRFASGEAFPSRFILYDGREGELEEFRQALIDVNWEDFGKIKFLHTPKVELISTERKILAVSLAGASELANVTNISPLPVAEKEETFDQSVDEDYIEEQDKIDEEKLAEMGFALERDVAEGNTGTVEQMDFQNKKEDGYGLKDEGITEKAFSAEFVNPEMETASEIDSSHHNVAPVDEAFSKKRGSISTKFRQLTGTIPVFFSGILKRKSKAGVPSLKTQTNKPFIYGGVFLLLLLMAGFAAWWFLPKASVTVYVSPQKLEEHIEIFVDPKAESSDISNKILPGKELKTTVDGEKTKSTTGTKTVGDKATGEVTLYRVGTELSLTEGTTLTGPDNLRFTLNDAVKIASGSASSPGTTKAGVTSENIGSQYNLSSGNNFKVGNYTVSDIEAKNEDAFSGGSSRDISAVSSSDQKELLEDLTQELEEKAAQELVSGLDESQFFITEALTATSSSTSFSAKVGDEAETLKLSMELDAVGYAVDKSELIKLAQEALKDKVPNGFVLRDEQIDVEFEYKDKKDGTFVFEATVDANLLPQVDPDTVAKKILGKHRALADEFLKKEISGYSRSTIRLTPNLPGRLATLPRLVKNIEIEISAER